MTPMPAPDDAPRPAAHLSAALAIGGERVPLEIDVPAGPVRTTALLPSLQSLAGAIVGAAVRREEKEGRAISCGPGCGACCRQLVPVAPAEARAIAALVESLPEGRRAVIDARFGELRRRLAGSGLLESLESAQHLDEDARAEMAAAYFALGLACPFLEEESCSIHPDRPIACREHLVTSPASACATPTPDTVRMVPVAARVWGALVRVEAAGTVAERGTWVPLSLAPSWAAAHPDRSEPVPGPRLFEQVVGELLRVPRG